MSKKDNGFRVSELGFEKLVNEKTGLHYKTLFENSISGIGVATLDGDIIDCNPALLKMLGFSSLKELQKHKLVEFYVDLNDQKKIKSILKSKGFIIEYKFKLKQKTDKILTALINANLVSTDLGTLAVVNFLDISEKEMFSSNLTKLNEELENKVKERTEEQQQSENKFKGIFESSLEAMVLLTSEGFLDCNKAALEMFGCKEKKDLLKLHPVDLSPEKQEDGSNSFELSKRLISEALIGNGDKFEWLHKKSNGKTFHAEIILSPIFFNHKKVLHAIIRDISLRKEAQESLKKSEEKYRGLIENLKKEYFFYRTDIKGIFNYVSPSVKNILGYNEEQFLGHYSKYLTDNPVNMEATEKSELGIQGIEQPPFEVEIYDFKNNIRTLNVAETPIKDSAGNVVSIEGIAHDITNQKIAEDTIKTQLKEIQIRNEEILSINEELNAVNDDLELRIKEINNLNIELSYSKTKYERLVKNIPGIVFKCRNDQHWTMEYISNEVEVLTGFKANDFIMNSTRSFASIIHPDDVQNVDSIINESLNESDSYSVEYRLVNSEKQIVWVYERGQKFMRGKKEIINGVILDITDKKIVEEKLIESERKLKISNAQKDTFFSLIAHDLRSPVGNFVQISELLKSDYASLPEDTIQEFFDNLQGLAGRTYKLLDNLLMWSQSQLGKIVVKPTNLNLKLLVDEIALLYDENIKGKQIEFKNEIPKNLIINADNNIINTVFRNLISNAIKFTYREGIISVKIKSEFDKDNEEYYLISVQDNGTGISKNKIDKILNIDENLSELGTYNEKGTGLGLILCKELIEKTGGKLTFNSIEGVGSEFSFTLKP